MYPTFMQRAGVREVIKKRSHQKDPARITGDMAARRREHLCEVSHLTHLALLRGF